MHLKMHLNLTVTDFYRERNRLNAKKARLRKKQLMGSLQGQLAVLRGENVKLRRVIACRIPEKSLFILNKLSKIAELSPPSIKTEAE